MNGHNNYHVGQQIFYVYDEQQLKRLLLLLRNNDGVNKDADEKPRNGYLVTPGMGAHKVYRRHLSWSNAREACAEDGGKGKESKEAKLFGRDVASKSAVIDHARFARVCAN